MSTGKMNNLQLGQSGTATQNFTMSTGNNGTMKLARGNQGATTQDLATVDAAGKVTLHEEAQFPNGLSANSLPAFQCRAWVVFNGTNGTMKAGGNVASVVRNGMGDYTITFTTAMPDSNYGLSGTASGSSGAGAATNVAVLGLHSTSGSLTLKSTTAVRVVVTDNNTDNLYDYLDVTVLIHR